jgi:hypothetical protein
MLDIAAFYTVGKRPEAKQGVVACAAQARLRMFSTWGRAKAGRAARGAPHGRGRSKSPTGNVVRKRRLKT